MSETRNVLENQLRKGGGRLPAGLPWQLLIFSFVILGVTFASYFGIAFGYKPYLDSQISNVNAQIDNLEKSVDKQQKENLTNLYSQLTNIKFLLNSHVEALKLFDDLEKNTNPQVYYTGFGLSLIENKIEIKGVAPNYGTLVQQLDLFKKSQLFGNVLVNNSKSTVDGISFSVQAILNPGELE
ncbi:MAG: PilN domain-containing protein [Spirochaetota bacterium]